MHFQRFLKTEGPHFFVFTNNCSQTYSSTILSFMILKFEFFFEACGFCNKFLTKLTFLEKEKNLALQKNLLGKASTLCRGFKPSIKNLLRFLPLPHTVKKIT